MIARVRSRGCGGFGLRVTWRLDLAEGELNVRRIGGALALLAAISLLAEPRAVEAQDAPVVFENLRATPKGTIGLGLVGAELGLIIPSVSGLNKAWALSVFPIVGATGGALAGYFALDKPGRAKGSVAALVVGLAGVMPAILVTVKGVRKERQDRWEPTQQIQLRSEKEKRALETAEAGPGLFRRSRSGLRIAAPALSFSRRAVQDAETLRMGGLRDRTEVRLSLASGVF